MEAHKKRTEEPLVLAVRYNLQEEDIYLLEVLAGFPGGDDDELLTTEFDRSASLLIFGKLHLSLGSPAQLRSAIAHGDEMARQFRGGQVLYEDGSQAAKELRQALGL